MFDPKNKLAFSYTMVGMNICKSGVVGQSKEVYQTLTAPVVVPLHPAATEIAQIIRDTLPLE